MLAVVNSAQERVMDALLASKPDLDHQDKVCLIQKRFSLNSLLYCKSLPVW